MLWCLVIPQLKIFLNKEDANSLVLPLQICGHENPMHLNFVLTLSAIYYIHQNEKIHLLSGAANISICPPGKVHCVLHSGDIYGFGLRCFGDFKLR